VLEAGDEVTVVLCLDSDGPQRQDLCANCGKAVGNETDGFYWKRERPADGDSRPVVDYVFLQEMFGRMLEREEDVYRRLAYLVGLVLIRKRYLRLKGFEARDGREVMIVTRGAGQPEQVVPAPYLSAEDMVDTREMLTRLLAADLPDGDLPESTPSQHEPEADGVDGGVAQGSSGPVEPPAPENN
jgi:hypothetical protein